MKFDIDNPEQLGRVDYTQEDGMLSFTWSYNPFGVSTFYIVGILTIVVILAAIRSAIQGHGEYAINFLLGGMVTCILVVGFKALLYVFCKKNVAIDNNWGRVELNSRYFGFNTNHVFDMIDIKYAVIKQDDQSRLSLRVGFMRQTPYIAMVLSNDKTVIFGVSLNHDNREYIVDAINTCREAWNEQQRKAVT